MPSALELLLPLCTEFCVLVGIELRGGNCKNVDFALKIFLGASSTDFLLKMHSKCYLTNFPFCL